MIEQTFVDSMLCFRFTCYRCSLFPVLIVFYHSHSSSYLEFTCFKTFEKYEAVGATRAATARARSQFEQLLGILIANFCFIPITDRSCLDKLRPVLDALVGVVD